jgi:hypothetical protein
VTAVAATFGSTAGGTSIITIQNNDTSYGTSTDYTVNSAGISFTPSGNWNTAARVVGLRLGTFESAGTRDTGLAFITANAGTEAEKMRITSGGAMFNRAATAGHTAFIGAIGPGNVGDRYLHVRINTIQNMMVWIKVFGYYQL